MDSDSDSIVYLCLTSGTYTCIYSQRLKQFTSTRATLYRVTCRSGGASGDLQCRLLGLGWKLYPSLVVAAIINSLKLNIKHNLQHTCIHTDKEEDGQNRLGKRDHTQLPIQKLRGGGAIRRSTQSMEGQLGENEISEHDTWKSVVDVAAIGVLVPGCCGSLAYWADVLSSYL